MCQIISSRTSVWFRPDVVKALQPSLHQCVRPYIDRDARQSGQLEHAGRVARKRTALCPAFQPCVGWPVWHEPGYAVLFAHREAHRTTTGSLIARYRVPRLVEPQQSGPERVSFPQRDVRVQAADVLSVPSLGSFLYIACYAHILTQAASCQREEHQSTFCKQSRQVQLVSMVSALTLVHARNADLTGPSATVRPLISALHMPVQWARCPGNGLGVPGCERIEQIKRRQIVRSSLYCQQTRDTFPAMPAPGK
jgi:hypothetical protein